MSINNENKQLAIKGYTKKFKGFMWYARTRILFSYILVFGVTFVVFVPAFRGLLYARVNTRVYSETTEKMHVFNELVGTDKKHHIQGKEHTETNLLRNADQRLLKPPSSEEELEEFFDGFLGNQLPEDDTYLIALMKGRFYKSSPRARPKQLSIDSKIINDWAKLTKPEEGEKVTSSNSVGSIIYLAQPVMINDKIIGVFVIARTTAGERNEVLEAVGVIIQVAASLLFLVLVLGWFASGKILAPLRLLTQTARSINGSDLNQRITVKGEGEIAELAATFNEMMDRLKVAFTSQRDFLNDAGHELRTPITIIHGHLELMGDDPQERQETLALVMDELERMKRLVNDLILLAKVEHPNFLHLQTFDINSFTEEIFAKAQALGERNWQLEAVATGKIVGDRQRLTQAIMNLAENATQYTKPTDTIALGSVIHQGKVKFWVRDTGEGIPQDEQKRIFERFARAINSRRRYEGSGLGLSIVQAIVEAHGGEITLISQLGKGAKFILILPPEATSSHNRQ
ncbi:sensor histidine kinase [Calothrix sp. PCC 6303]|uniref:sensor histidine kinase n=1 Tax=Calothrix sp. PCC 6303 TaxID=1170562 RepID=UPI0002A023C0|nr:HAMP domain-containing sensor histidine kinase [Calothrix sp. PCC 6303]AFZ01803.1 integral membrane sensor signal transduction histidine kinase [Calothrix sp. PCC 6303]